MQKLGKQNRHKPVVTNGIFKTNLLYADDGVVASTDPGWLQLAFDF